MKMKLCASLLLLTFFIGFAQKNASNGNCSIQFKSDGFKNNKYYLAGNYGKYQTLLDSVIATKDGKVNFKKNEKYVEGIYMLVDKDKKIVTEFLMDEKQQFIILPDLLDPKNTIIENSPLNSNFQAFNLFIKSNLDKIATYKTSLAEQKTKKDSLTVKNNIIALQTEITNYKNSYIEKNKNTLSLLFLLTRPIDDFSNIPAATKLTTKKDSIEFLKTNYFKDIDLSDERIIRTPFLENKMDNYFNTFVVQTPEEVTKEVFAILENCGNKNGDMFKYLSLYFVNKYVDPKIMGMDRVFLNINEKYFKNKEYDWLKLEQKEFFKYQEKCLKHVQIGDKAPNLFMTTLDEKRIDLYDIQAPYIVVAFWDPTCGHCAKEIPKMIAIYNKDWKAKGIKVFAINNNPKENVKWKEFIEKEKLEEWINVYPPSVITGNYTKEEVDFQTLYNVVQTPVFFLLDKDKTIIAKKIIFENYIDLIKDIEKKQKAEGK